MIKVNGQDAVFKTFPNGETKIVEDSIAVLDWGKHRVSFKYESDEDLIKLMFVKNFIDGKRSKSTIVELVIYYMPYSRMDRSEGGSAFTLKYVANFINGLNFDKVVVVEPHSDVTPALLNNVEAKYINFDLLPIVMDEVGFDKDEDFIVFPDTGASKRYQSMDTIKNVLIGHKQRNFQTGEITSFDLVGSMEGLGDKAIIIDDLSSYGGTFVHTSKALREKGFNEIYLLVAHAEWSVFEGVLFQHIDKLFTTNSIIDNDPLVYRRFDGKFKVYNVEEVL